MVKIQILLVLLLTYAIVGTSQNYIEGVPPYKGDIEFIRNNTIYPDSAKICKIEGRVFVEFDIDTLGNTQNHRVKYGIRDDFNNEAIRVASLMKFDPITKNGIPIEYKDYMICVNFKLPKEGRKKNR